MAITAAVVASEPRSFSIGPWKMQIHNFSAASAATGGTITASGMHEVIFCSVTGVSQTAAPTFSGNVVTIAFTDPAATVHGQAIVIGR